MIPVTDPHSGSTVWLNIDHIQGVRSPRPDENVPAGTLAVLILAPPPSPAHWSPTNPVREPVPQVIAAIQRARAERLVPIGG